MSADKQRGVTLGTRQVQFPSKDLGELADCNHLLGDQEALRAEMKDKGYLFIRGLHDREEVLHARLAVLQHIKLSGKGKLRTGFPWQDGVLAQRCGVGCIPFMEGVNPITHCKAVSKVLEGPRPFSFFKTFFGENANTFNYKWLRGMHTTGFTGAHVDNVYMSRGTTELYTMWTPFADVTVDMGTLAVCEESHRLPQFKHFQETYGNMDCEEINLKGTGWFTCDPEEISQKFGGTWKTADFRAGDVIIFTMRTVHMSTVNVSDYVRISCDTRWQPSSHPMDPRFIGDSQSSPRFGLHALADEIPNKTKEEEVTIETLRDKWGI